MCGEQYLCNPLNNCVTGHQKQKACRVRVGLCFYSLRQKNAAQAAL